MAIFTYIGMAVVALFYLLVVARVIRATALTASITRCKFACARKNNGRIIWHLLPIGICREWREVLNDGAGWGLNGRHPNGGGYKWRGFGDWEVW